MKMKILIIGYGSIGRRHAKNVAALGHTPVLLRSSHANANTDGYREYFTLRQAIGAENNLSAAIICSPTSAHEKDVRRLVTAGIPFLLEKPPAISAAAAGRVRAFLKREQFTRYDIAYNMRYYPVLQAMRDALPRLGKVQFARVASGYFLPWWRPSVDYRTTISARRELGGGVHRELVHEIDYIVWFFGAPAEVFSVTAKVSGLEISSEDICAAVFRYKSGLIVELHLDYLSHRRLRTCQVTGEKGTLDWDIEDGRLDWYGACRERAVLYRLPKDYDFNATYLDELRGFLKTASGRGRAEHSMDSASIVMNALDAMEKSSRTGRWTPVRGANKDAR